MGGGKIYIAIRDGDKSTVISYFNECRRDFADCNFVRWPIRNTDKARSVPDTRPVPGGDARQCL